MSLKGAILSKLLLYPTTAVFGAWIVWNWSYYYNPSPRDKEAFKKNRSKVKAPEVSSQQRQILEAKWAEQKEKQKLAQKKIEEKVDKKLASSSAT